MFFLTSMFLKSYFKKAPLPVAYPNYQPYGCSGCSILSINESCNQNASLNVDACI